MPAECWRVSIAAAERRFDEVQPDVYYELDSQLKVAVEVRYAHAVDEMKAQKLRSVVSMCAEFDVSDLPAVGIGRRDLDRLLAEPARWKWLINGRIRNETSILQEEIRWTHTRWRLHTQPRSVPKAAAKAPIKLKMAESRVPWAKAQLVKLKAEAKTPEQSMQWLGAQDKIDRVAVACAALGLHPSVLPVFFLQALEGKNAGAFGHHPYSWQVILFMKFGIGRDLFTAHTAGEWADVAMPDRVSSRSNSKSLNGFTRTAAVIQIYFLNLEAQGLLYSDQAKPLESRQFRPRFATASEMREFLEGAHQ